MAKHSSKSEGGSSSKTKKSKKPTQDKSPKSELSPMERYLLENQRYEQIAIGEPYDRSATREELERWDQEWQAASNGQ
ncbi:hypothetical protein F4776DRAFT_663129 [Hypoxylon sp. NC0597]|nr:hypothetical protein F4776DRAFT_663129 [Hypoxylon sp. NC0597]